MKWIFGLGFLLILEGCAGTPATVDINGLAISATDRIAAWSDINREENKARIAIAEAEKAKAEIEKAKIDSKAKIIYRVDDPLTLAIHFLEKANERLYKSNQFMGRVALASVTGQDSSVYNGVPHTQFPGGAFAEGFKSFFGGAAEVLRTPTAVIVGGAWGLSKVIDNMPESGTEFHGDVASEGSFNDQVVSQAGSSGSISAAPSAIKPEVVHADVIHADQL